MKTISKALAAKELSKREIKKEIILNPTFSKQNAFILDLSRYIDAQCSRRAGKTKGLAIRYFRTLDKYKGSECLYLSLTRDSAHEIMWPVLQELNKEFNLGYSFIESKLIMKRPDGSRLKLYGADMKNFIKRLKGRKYSGVGIDEAQDFGVHLQSLIDDVLTPAISDYPDSWLALTGTPGPVPQGHFFDITKNRMFGYSHHEWTLQENPYMPNPAAFIADLKAKRQWLDNNPTLLREWLNKWVLDVQSLWIQYNEGVNHYETLPHHKFTYIAGIDLGFKDADAVAVLAWSEETKNTYLVEEYVAKKQGITELVDAIKKLQKKYDISKLVIDQGGLGLKVAEEIRRRHHVPVVGAEKQRKQETVGFFNDALRLGNFKAKKDSRFAQDSYLVQIDWEKTTPDRIVVKKHPHSDIIDAVIYAFKESPAFTYQAPKVKPGYKTKEWFEEQVNEMEEKAIEYFTDLENASKESTEW